MVWLGAKTKGNYGRLCRRTGGKSRYFLAHRYAYEQIVGDIPKGQTLDHLCGNPPCVNPDHLEPVGLRENILRGRTGKNLLKTECPQGHPYSGRNLYVSPQGWRRCRACIKKATKQWYNNKKEEE